MANKTKVGLTYFPFEVTFFSDIKVRKLIKYQGCKATAVYTLLLCNIYENGYYMRWDIELPFIISEKTGYEEGYVKEVIACCLNIGLFSKDLFDKEMILTSKGIQDRFELICRQSKRKANIFDYKINSEELVINSEELVINSEELLQSKVKERKGKEKKENSEKEGKLLKAKYEPDFWRPAVAGFLKDGHFKSAFCKAKGIEYLDLEKKMNDFVIDLNLKMDYKDLAGLKSHFTNHYRKHVENAEKDGNSGSMSKAFIETPKDFNYNREDMVKW